MQRLKFTYQGDAFAIKLDKKANQRGHAPLYHFLNDVSQPWSKRCDFVVFHRLGNSINVYCIECKYKTINEARIAEQILASENWVKTLSKVIAIYTKQKRTFRLRRYVVTECPNPTNHPKLLNGFLASEPKIQHLSYASFRSGQDLSHLSNPHVEQIR